MHIIQQIHEYMNVRVWYVNAMRQALLIELGRYMKGEQNPILSKGKYCPYVCRDEMMSVAWDDGVLVQLSIDHEEIWDKYKRTKAFRIEAADGVHKRLQHRVRACVAWVHECYRRRWTVVMIRPRLSRSYKSFLQKCTLVKKSLTPEYPRRCLWVARDMGP